MQIGIANGIPLNDVITGDDLVPAYDQSTGTEGYVNLTTAVQKAFSGSVAGTANGVLYLNGSKVATGGSALTFDGSNLGLGITPSAWQLGGNFELGLGRAVAFNSYQGSVAANAYYNNGWLYKTANAAAKYDLDTGAHKWYTAPSGTAGNPISFTQAMTLDASGNLLVGTTSSGAIAAGGVVLGNLSNAIGGAAGGGILTMSGATTTSYVGLFSNPNGAVGSITLAGATTAYNTSSDYRLKTIAGPVTNSGAYIDSLNPVEGTWKADGSTFVGLIAHEVQEVSRTQVATGEKDGEQMQAMDYSNSELIANLIAEVKSLRARVAALESN